VAEGRCGLLRAELKYPLKIGVLRLTSIKTEVTDCSGRVQARHLTIDPASAS
jgi:hypothetical protein